MEDPKASTASVAAAAAALQSQTSTQASNLKEDTIRHKILQVKEVLNDFSPDLDSEIRKLLLHYSLDHQIVIERMLEDRFQFHEQGPAWTSVSSSKLQKSHPPTSPASASSKRSPNAASASASASASAAASGNTKPPGFHPKDSSVRSRRNGGTAAGATSTTATATTTTPEGAPSPASRADRPPRVGAGGDRPPRSAAASGGDRFDGRGPRSRDFHPRHPHRQRPTAESFSTGVTSSSSSFDQQQGASSFFTGAPPATGFFESSDATTTATQSSQSSPMEFFEQPAHQSNTQDGQTNAQQQQGFDFFEKPTTSPSSAEQLQAAPESTADHADQQQRPPRPSKKERKAAAAQQSPTPAAAVSSPTPAVSITVPTQEPVRPVLSYSEVAKRNTLKLVESQQQPAAKPMKQKKKKNKEEEAASATTTTLTAQQQQQQQQRSQPQPQQQQQKSAKKAEAEKKTATAGAQQQTAQAEKQSTKSKKKQASQVENVESAAPSSESATAVSTTATETEMEQLETVQATLMPESKFVETPTPAAIVPAIEPSVNNWTTTAAMVASPLLPPSQTVGPQPAVAAAPFAAAQATAPQIRPKPTAFELPEKELIIPEHLRRYQPASFVFGNLEDEEPVQQTQQQQPVGAQLMAATAPVEQQPQLHHQQQLSSQETQTEERHAASAAAAQPVVMPVAQASARMSHVPQHQQLQAQVQPQVQSHQQLQQAQQPPQQQTQQQPVGVPGAYGYVAWDGHYNTENYEGADLQAMQYSSAMSQHPYYDAAAAAAAYQHYTMDPSKFGMANVGAADATAQGEDGQQLEDASSKTGTATGAQQTPGATTAAGAAGVSSSFAHAKFMHQVPVPPYPMPQYYYPYMIPGNFQYPFKNAAAGYYYQNAYPPTAAPMSGSTTTAGMPTTYGDEDYSKYPGMSASGAGMPTSSYYGQAQQGGVAAAGVQDTSGKMMSASNAPKSYNQQGTTGTKPPPRQPRTQTATNAPQGYPDSRMYSQRDQYYSNRQYGQYNPAYYGPMQ